MRGSIKKRVLVIAGSIAAVPLLGSAVYAGFVVFGPAVHSYRHQLPFDSDSWKSRSLDDGIMWPTRLRMADDLIRTQRLHRLSRPEVERLLGAPDETAKFKQWDLVYHLGPERGLIRIDSEWLVVRFGADGRVSEHKLVRD